MAGEQEAIAPDSGQETAPQIEENAAQVANDAETETREGNDAGEPELVEIDWEDGTKYTIPKALEGGLLRHKDYTQKRQADADAARSRASELDARQADIEHRLGATDEELDLRAHLRHVDAEVERFKDYNYLAFQQAYQLDPIGAQQAWDYAQEMRRQKGDLSSQLKDAQSKRTANAQQDLAKRFQETLAAAPTIIPGWKPEKANETIGGLVAFANSAGIPEQTLKANWSPVMLELLFLARTGKQLLAKPAAPKQPTAPATPPTTVGGGSTPSTSPSGRDSIRSWMEKRNKQVTGKRA